MTQVSIDFSDELMMRISKKAEEKGMSLSQYIFFIVDEHIINELEKEIKDRN